MLRHCLFAVRKGIARAVRHVRHMPQYISLAFRSTVFIWQLLSLNASYLRGSLEILRIITKPSSSVVSRVLISGNPSVLSSKTLIS